MADFFHGSILLEQLECLHVFRMGIQIDAQLEHHELQCLELYQRIGGKGAAFHFQMEGQIRTGKQRTVTQGIPLRIFLRPILLKGDIGDSQPGTRGVCRNSPGSWPIRPRCKFLCSMQDSSLCGLEDCSSAPSYAVGERRPRRDTGVPEHIRGGSPSFSEELSGSGLERAGMSGFSDCILSGEPL